MCAMDMKSLKGIEQRFGSTHHLRVKRMRGIRFFVVVRTVEGAVASRKVTWIPRDWQGPLRRLEKDFQSPSKFLVSLPVLTKPANTTPREHFYKMAAWPLARLAARKFANSREFQIRVFSREYYRNRE